MSNFIIFLSCTANKKKLEKIIQFIFEQQKISIQPLFFIASNWQSGDKKKLQNVFVFIAMCQSTSNR